MFYSIISTSPKSNHIITHILDCLQRGNMLMVWFSSRCTICYVGIDIEMVDSSLEGPRSRIVGSSCSK